MESGPTMKKTWLYNDRKRMAAFVVEVQGGEIIVSLPEERFRAVYYKAASQPQLILRERSRTDDYELLADVWLAANDKARELG
jgi:hypothetical protein